MAALQDLALAYLHRDGQAIPFWRMASTKVATLRQRASALGVGSPTDMDAMPGGGTLPTVTIPSAGISLQGDHSRGLRETDGTRPPIVARVHEGNTYLDLRTVDPAHDSVVAQAVAELPRTPADTA